MDTPAIVTVTPHAQHVSGKTTWSFVRVTLADGMAGWGEATINGREADIAAEVRRQEAVLRGRAGDVAIPLPPLAPGQLGWAVVSAIDQALWDIAARRAGQSLAAYLGTGVLRPSVPLYANINRGILDRSPAGFAAAADAAADAGFSAVKIAPFDDLTPVLAGGVGGARLIRSGLDRIAAAHAALAGRATLMVDCHWRFTAATAEAALREAALTGITWFECPLPETAETMADIVHLRGVANAAGVRLAGLETASCLADFLPWADAYDVVMPDVKYAGGLAETLRIAEVLGAKGVGISLHNPTGSVCHAVSLHVSAALESNLPLEIQWGESDLLFDLPSPALQRPVAGRSPLPSGDGHGAALPL